LIFPKKNHQFFDARSSAVADSFTTREDAKKQKALQEAIDFFCGTQLGAFFGGWIIWIYG
jgi:F0F1-type ATP synthase assembly protein I